MRSSLRYHTKAKTSRSTDIINFDSQNLAYCPVTFFLALAFADDVFQDVSSLAEICEKYGNVEEGTPQKIRYKPHKRDLVIFARANQQERQALDYTTFINDVRALSHRAGAVVARTTSRRPLATCASRGRSHTLRNHRIDRQ